MKELKHLIIQLRNNVKRVVELDKQNKKEMEELMEIADQVGMKIDPDTGELVSKSEHKTIVKTLKAANS